MLSRSLWLACLWFSYSLLVKSQDDLEANCTVGDDELPEVQSGINNFVIDMLGTMQFAYALDQCTETSVLTTGRRYKYECDMDSNTGMSTVTKTEYFNVDCSGTGTVIATFNETNMTEGEVGFFECGGSNTYARIRLSLASDCVNAAIIYAALGACSMLDQSSQINFYCSAGEAIGQIFITQMPMTTFLPSSTLSTGFNATLTTDFNATLTTDFNATLPSLLNATLPTLINATLATLFNSTLPTMFNATLPSLINATLPSLINATLPMSTTQINPIMMCEEDSFCHRWILNAQCTLVTQVSFGIEEDIYAQFEECSVATNIISSTTTMLATPFNTSLIGATEPTGDTSTSTTRGTQTTSGAIRPSLLFTAGVFFSFFFLVSV